METNGDERVSLEVRLPVELLRDMDRFAVQNGYENHSAVVREALD